MNILVQRSDVGEFRRRYRWMVVFVLLTFLVFVGKLFQLQVVEHDLHHATARKNIVRHISLATTRGVIRDAHGNVLAANRPSYNVYVAPDLLDMKRTWPRVARLMGLGEMEEQLLRKRIEEVPLPRRTQQILLKADVDREVLATLKTHESELRGVEVAHVPVRYYPHGELGAHLVGYMREVDGEMLARPEYRGYRPGDRLGAIGVERRWESYVRGQRGWRKIVRGGGGRKDPEELVERYLDEPRRLDPVPGRDISLTVDVELERSIEKAMRGQLAGAVVIVDVRTGRLLAGLSKPSFDPNVVSGGSGQEIVGDAFRRLYADPLKPTLDKTQTAAYPPGSTYKPFAALAALADRLISPRGQVDCRGGYEFGRRFFRCTGVHRHVNLHQAIVQSCNTYFYALGEQLEIDKLAKIGLDFGFGAKTGLGVNPEARGRMPTRGWYTRRYKGRFYGGYKLLAAIGQGASTVNVLQLALAYAALANGGTLYQPQVVRSIETSDGTIVQEFPPRVRRMVSVDREDLSRVKRALYGVVQEREGTAHAERFADVDLAGKTGTAEVRRVSAKSVDPDKVWYFNRDHAWFAGYAPSTSPEIAIVVLVEHGGAGGKNAVPVAMRIVRDWQNLKAKRFAARATAPRENDSPEESAL